MNKFTKTAIASIFSFSAVGAYSAAFQLAEVSTSGLGMAYAGNAAVADNASVVANNPALMTQFKNTEISAGAVVVEADTIIRGKVGTQGAYASNVIPTAAIPSIYAVSPVTDRFALGAGVNVNYGLKSEYPNDFNAGFFGGKTELTAYNFNLSGAYDLGAGVSVGAGVNAVYSDATIERRLGLAGLSAALTAKQRALQLQGLARQAAMAGNATAAAQYAQGATQAASLARAYASLPKDTLIAKIYGDKWSFGWNAGLTYQINENNRLGFSYRSAVDVKFKGKYTNNLALPLGETVQYPMAGQVADGSLTLYLPAVWEASGYHKLTDKFALQYSYKYTEWDRLKTLDAYGLQGQQYLHKPEYFSNSSRYSVGVSYDVDEALKLRAGVAYDQTASRKFQSISIPDTNRMWYSVGATYKFTPNLSVDAGYAFLRGTKNSFNEENRAFFETKARANLYGLNLNYKF